MSRWGTGLVVALTASLATAAALAQSAASGPAVGTDRIVVVSPSQKICQLSGETDRQTGKPTVSQTQSRYGMTSADHGYAFEHNGRVYFLMGDPIPPPPTFKGAPNRQVDPPRKLQWNDMIAFTSDTTIDDCLKLDFVTYPNGAYKNPVVLNDQGEPAFTGFINESPESGISDGGKIYVIFRTDNPDHDISNPNTGFATRTAVGASDDDGNTFRYAYDFSKGPGAKFINVAIATGPDRYIYFMGSAGGELYRKSAPYLARKPVGGMGQPTIEYLSARGRDGKPAWSSREADAVALFHDVTASAAGPVQADCVGEMGLAWNPYLSRWLLLYNCFNATPRNPRGIYARVAEQPWGPWSEPATIFGLVSSGFCVFVHRAVTATQPRCDNLADPGKDAESGAAYGPYIIPRFTTGDAAKATTTFYHIVDTWNPYTQVIMKATIALQK
jgi:hypothetical protein